MFRKRFFFYIKRGSSLFKKRKLSLFTYKLSSPGLAGKNNKTVGTRRRWERARIIYDYLHEGGGGEGEDINAYRLRRP
jgi:hypothetical protein